MYRGKAIGHSSLLFCNIFFGINYSASKFLVDSSMDPFALNEFRYLTGFILFWLVSLFKWEKVDKRDLIVLFVGSLCGLLVNQVLFLQGLTRTTAIHASIISTSIPIFTMLLAGIILKEPTTLKKVVGVIIGAAGAILVILSGKSDGGSEFHLIGDILCLLSASLFAMFLVLTKDVTRKYNTITVMKWMFLFAFVLFTPFSYSYALDTPFASWDTTSFLSFFFVIIFATFVPYLLIPIGQRFLRPTTVSMYNYLQPIVSAIVIVIIGEEKFTVSNVLAALLVFFGVYLVTKSKSKKDLEEENSLDPAK